MDNALRGFLYSAVESDESLNRATNSLDAHYRLFYEFNATPMSIVVEIESILNDYAPSSTNSSYYIDLENRFRVFKFLSHLINNPTTFKQKGQYQINDQQMQNIDAQCAKICEIIGSKLHCLIFELVFPCNSAVQQQYDEMIGICEMWSNNGLFSKSFQISNILNDLRNKTNLSILNQDDYEEPSNLDEFIQSKPARNHFVESNNQRMPMSVDQRRPNPNMNGRGYGYRPPPNNNHNNGYMHNNNNNSNKSRYEYNPNIGYDTYSHPNSYQQPSPYKPPNMQNVNNNMNNMHSNVASLNSVTRSCSPMKDILMANKSKMEQTEIQNKIDEEESKKEYDLLCKQSVIAAVNPYPDGKAFSDENKMCMQECEDARRKQRAKRTKMQLKEKNESFEDEFEKFYDEGMKRWDLVKESCLDSRIWEWQINLNYNDSQSQYGTGVSCIRNSPFFKKQQQMKRSMEKMSV